jgi:hypothetical protein
MNHIERARTISFLRPNAEFVLNGDELNWLDTKQIQPTNAEIETGWVAYQATQAAQAEAKATAKAALLAQLGITEEQAKLLLS